MRTWAGWLTLLLATGLVVTSPARAYYLDQTRNFDVRLRMYAQLGIMMEDAESYGCAPTWTTKGPNGERKYLPNGDPRICPPQYKFGDLAQERNFYNPEFDAKLTDYTSWMKDMGMSAVAPDELKFRFAWWGFYDGIYDYLDPEWNQRRRDLLTRFSQSDAPNLFNSYQFRDQNKNARHIYGSRNRINELYVDYTKGPLFFRVGRQAISWGESDTIALLDVSNPFDLTLGAPGFFQDVDEARIPLWTFRSTVKLLDQYKQLSSLFLDSYLVPGPIDTTVPINPIAAGVSPFTPDQSDPQFNEIYGPTRTPSFPAPNGILATGNYEHVVITDRLPAQNWGNSRWGARLTGVLMRDYTVQGWFFRTFNQQPVPLLSSFPAAGAALNGTGMTLVDDRGFRVDDCTLNGAPLKRPAKGGVGLGQTGVTPSGRPCSWAAPVVTSLERRLESVMGLAATWYSQPLDGIIRTEAELFLDELAFIPSRNLNPRTQIPPAFRNPANRVIRNSMPTANYLRWVLGYDKFFFLRALNPTNSFLLSTSYNSSFNLSEHSGKDYRYPYTKPGHHLQAMSRPLPGNPACQGSQAYNNPLCVSVDAHDFVDAYQYEGFLQTAIQTDYMHGRLEPRLVFIDDVSGIFAFAPSVTYRLSDNLLLSGTYLAIAGTRKAGIGVFRGHDMLQLRVTAQLN
jgi:hypothetical protein